MKASGTPQRILTLGITKNLHPIICTFCLRPTVEKTNTPAAAEAAFARAVYEKQLLKYS